MSLSLQRHTPTIFFSQLNQNYLSYELHNGAIFWLHDAIGFPDSEMGVVLYSSLEQCNHCVESRTFNDTPSADMRYELAGC